MAVVKGSTKDAIAFLKRWGAGPWVITTIVPDGGMVRTRTFHPDQEPALASFLNEAMGRANIYFTVNRTQQDVTIKPKKTDIAAMEWLHVDVDPRVGEDFAAERTRILEVLRGFTPAPTLIVDSGGGYQGFWRLEQPQETGGSVARAEELEAYNRQLELVLGGDHCFNIDRIMRLPGTVNVPDSRKRKKGRVEAQARVVEWHKTAYELAQFTPAPRVQTAANDTFGESPTVRISGNLPRLASVDDLPHQVSPHTKMLIVQGGDPDNPEKYGSRSELLFRVCIDLVRANCDDDTIASVIMDPDFKISASVLDKPRPEVYAARQISRAREEAIEPWLRKLNEKHAVIEDIGGKCRVISEVYDHALKRMRISRQSFDDFRNRYSNQHVEIGKSKEGLPVMIPVGKYWLGHPMRRQYESIVFAPGREVDGAFNLWKGFACEPRAGDCSLYLEHVEHNICGGDATLFSYLIKWMARAVQKPDCAGEVAIVLRGVRGAGKGAFIKIFGGLFGRHFMQVSNPVHLVGNFNSHLRDCVVLFGDESFYAGDKKHESVLKTLVTEEIIPIEAKGIDVEPAPNYTHILLASNSDWVVPAGQDERRYLMLEVKPSKKQDTQYFKLLYEQMDNGGREALLHHLMHVDISEFDVRTAPKTEALREQQMYSFTAEEQWWYEKLTDGRILRDHVEWETEVQKALLQDDYYNFCQRMRIMRPVNPTALSRFLKKASPPAVLQIFQRQAEVMVPGPYGEPLSRMGRPYFYRLPELTAARESFEKLYGGKFRWLEAPLITAQPQQPELPQAQVGKSPF